MSLIFSFAREAGGAEAIASVVKAVMKKHRVVLLAKDYAKDIFAKNSLSFTEIEGYSPDLMQNLIDKHGRPSLVLTSATSLPWNDMTEKYLWKWSAGEGTPSIGVLDQWQNYALRFSGVKKDEFLKYLPDYVCVMDEYAKAGMIREGIPKSRIVVTGQPAFDSVIKYKKFWTKKKSNEVRKNLGLKDEKMVLFVSEALRRDFEETLGYTEVTTLKAVLATLTKLTEESFKFALIVKLHPQNRIEDFNEIDFGNYKSLFMKFIAKEMQPKDLILSSDVVVGMASILLVESILCGNPTLSLQINTKRDDNLIATKMGAIPLITSAKEFERVLRSILADEEYLKGYLECQRKLSADGLATKRVAQLVETILGKSSVRCKIKKL